MRNPLARTARSAPGGRARSLRRTRSGRVHLAKHQVAAAELYIYRLRHGAASIESVAADLSVSPCTLQAWLDAYWTPSR